jgi:hypothetical protein
MKRPKPIPPAIDARGFAAGLRKASTVISDASISSPPQRT